MDRLLKDKKYFDKWQGIMRPGKCEGQCGEVVPHRIMSHLGEKSNDDIYRGVISPADKGSKNRLYHAMGTPDSYRFLCPTCDKKHETAMFSEGYNPVWNLDTRVRTMLADRAKKAKERARIKELRKKQQRLRYMIKSLLIKYEDFDDPNPRYDEDVDASGGDSDYGEDFEPMHEGVGGEQENVGKPVYNTKLGFNTPSDRFTPYKKPNLVNRIKTFVGGEKEVPKGRMGFIQDMIKEFLAKHEGKYPTGEYGEDPWDSTHEETTRSVHPRSDKYNEDEVSSLTGAMKGKHEAYVPMVTERVERKTPHGARDKTVHIETKYKFKDRDIHEPKRKYEPSLLNQLKSFIAKQAYEGKYKPEYEARTKLNNKLAPYQTSKYQMRSEVNPHPAPPMGFGAKTEDADHIPPYRVPRDNTKVFKYRGKMYDAARMTPEEISNILAEMESQIK